MQKSLCACFSAFVTLPEATEMTSSKIRFPAELTFSFPSRILLTSISMLSFILRYVFLLPVILMTGAMGDPKGVPLPVVKRTICTPPATMPGKLLYIMGWGIHIDQPFFRWVRRIGDDLFEGTRPCFVNAAEGFLLKGRDALRQYFPEQDWPSGCSLLLPSPFVPTRPLRQEPVSPFPVFSPFWQEGVQLRSVQGSPRG